MDTQRTVEKVIEIGCPSVEISAYIDGELSPQAETWFESHLSSCVTCSEELNYQKQFINVLSGSLNDLPELPADFTKRVVANAESGVSGLRQRPERQSAIFVCIGLLLFVLFTLGAKAPGAFAGLVDIAAGLYTVTAFTLHVVFDIAEGITIVLRIAVSRPAFSIPGVLGAVLIVAVTSYLVSQTRLTIRNDQLESGNVR